MSQTDSSTPATTNASTSTSPVKKKPTISSTAWWLREISAYLIWGFAFVKLFIYDIDAHFAYETAPILIPLLKYKGVILLCLIVVLWLLLGNRRFLKFILYVLFFPVSAFLWRVIVFAAKRWHLAIVFYPSIHSFILKFKLSLIGATLFLLSYLTILASSSSYLLVPAMAYLAAFYGVHIARRIAEAYRPADAFSKLAPNVGVLWSKIAKSLAFDKTEKLAAINTDDEKYHAERVAILGTIHSMSCILLMASRKLIKITNARTIYLYLILSFLWTILVTVTVFSVEYYGIEKLIPGSFIAPFSLSFWSFLGYSTDSFIPSSLSKVEAVSSLAMFASYAEALGASTILVILAYVFFTIGPERYKDDMKAVSAEIDRGLDGIEDHLREYYRLTLAEVEKILAADPKALKQVNGWREYNGLPPLDIEITSSTTDAIEAPVIQSSSTDASPSVSNFVKPGESVPVSPAPSDREDSAPFRPSDELLD